MIRRTLLQYLGLSPFLGLGVSSKSETPTLPEPRPNSLLAMDMNMHDVSRAVLEHIGIKPGDKLMVKRDGQWDRTIEVDHLFHK